MILKTKPYDHQREAYEDVKSLSFFALYMEMGTGKTRSIIEYIYQQNIKTVIYYCPVSLKANVKKDLEKHIENPLVYSECGKDELPEGYQFYIIGIESVNSDRVYLSVVHLLEKIKDCMVIVDESSYIKSFKAKRTGRIIRLSKKASKKAILTGTPLTQYYQDVFMQFKFLNENIIPYRSYYGFCERYLTFSEKFKGMITGSKNIDELIGCISPYVFQKTKKDCLDLPPKVRKDHWFSLSDCTREVYDTRKNEFLMNLGNYEGFDITIEIFKMYSDLQKIISDDSENRLESLKYLMEGEEKVCIFCKYLESVETIKEMFPGSVAYTGQQRQKERSKIIDYLDNVKILILTYGVGAYGLNLTMFNTCIFYDSNFKAEDRYQAEDRFHRIGQEKTVYYYTIRCENTIDEKIADNISLKKYVAEEFKDAINMSRKEIGNKVNKC